ncbi:hypothetical protein CUC08_Gglean009899 [Alternaria sp. MG1]|jgi:hypothetical protein|uniref:Indole-diterpene biosynthesis protein-like protein PaxU n=2 Tax=Alternaria alternata complex TaxID=187734 RepID=A0A4Q4NV35_ALTAL|nr:hypothetical protein B0T12DRAFT_107741 [Alternaria alternata]RII06671.1 hypothetical protein CUC08_Gglean009899 [Alternaria sp. MG1]RYN38571.1 hypothetical protein AA0115_g249 [Alternaria tenuissima]RYN59856.1 hypothetical protein AA0114_g1208 [Alternaria tenuissima]RYN69709.1 hypothetical protein AA0118_g495 [Alternaria tenuissima]
MANNRGNNDTIPGFELIAPSIWELDPRSASVFPRLSSNDLTAPSLILLCTWTGAQNRYIAKYTAEYRVLFPSTRIMVITTSAKDLCFRNSARKQWRMRPAIECISNYQYLPEQTPGAGILLHVFSEGGSNKACELAEAHYRFTGMRLPVSAICLDSTPGHPRYLRLCEALNKSLPQIPVLRHIAILFASLVLGCIWMLYIGIKGFENNVISRTRRRIIDPTYFDPSAPRCYLYSKSDTLIAWQDVSEHVEETETAGIPVIDIPFETSEHVGHAKEDPLRYWDAVMTTWQQAQIREKHTPHLTFSETGCVVLDLPKFPEFSEREWKDTDSLRNFLEVMRW